MNNEEMKKMIDEYIYSYNSFDIDGMLKNMKPTVIFQNISNGQVNMSTHGIPELIERMFFMNFFAQRFFSIPFL